MDGLKLLTVFGLIMIFLGRRAPLGPVMLGGSLLLAALYHAGPKDFLGMAWRATRDPATLELELILALIMLFEHLLGQQGYMERMLKSLRGLIHSPRVVMALLPAFIGLMPSAGGPFFPPPWWGGRPARPWPLRRRALSTSITVISGNISCPFTRGYSWLLI